VRAVQFLGNRESQVVERPDPRPLPGQVVVDMKRAAICGSDLHGYRHPPPEGGPTDRIPGHEPVGVISALGSDVTDLQVGQRVLVYHRVGCGSCLQCRTGNTNICSGTPLTPWHGSDCDRATVYAQYCYPMPDDLSWDTAVVIACQGGTAYAPLRRLGASGRTTIVVSGLGPVGLCTTMIGRAMGAEIVGIDPMKERRDLALRFGAAAAIDPATTDPSRAVEELVPGGADAVVETSGHGSAHGRVHDYLRVEGTAAIVGLGNRDPSVNPVHFFRKQLTMFASNLYPEWLLPEVVDFVRKRKVPLEQIITHTVPLAEAPAAFRLADTATTGKIVFSWPD
jgi:threonine dehydrogenase-like Zn-dependent dehydrogenase